MRYGKNWIENNIIPDLDQSDKDWLIEKFDGRFNPNFKLFPTWENELLPSIIDKLTAVGERLNMRLVSTIVFTGAPGVIAGPHIDKLPEYDPLPWRLSYFVQGGCPFHWWEPGEIIRLGPHVQIQEETEIVDTLDFINVKSAFVRTETPHSVDMTNNTKTRIVVSGTYTYAEGGGVPPWEYITNRLMPE